MLVLGEANPGSQRIAGNDRPDQRAESLLNVMRCVVSPGVALVRRAPG